MAHQDLKKLVRNHTRRLLKLLEQQALSGLDTPPGVLIEIEDIEAKLKKLQRELNDLQDEPGAKKLHWLLVKFAQLLSIHRITLEYSSGEIEEWVMANEQSD